MAISSSLYSSISGLSTMGEAMSVLGDNVANLNTLAFKSSRSTFQDVLAQSVSTASGSAQVGRGVTLSTVEGLFAQGSFESSTNATDMAIGGQGFFILRSPDTAEANLYSRAGEFRFDQEGNLVNPSGYFVQGWSIDQNTGDRQGTIGDINLGKSTPPVETSQIDVIYNLDADKPQEENNVNLFDAWDGRNAAAATPSPPIDPANYEYTSAIKAYDSKGASHDITIYFDTTTQENVWEFLVTCDPAEDKRNLDSRQQTIYAPDLTYNYENDKGAGALLYGTIEFSTNGDIKNMEAWDVPPDGEVDPALNTNRQVLQAGDNYYSFETNFTGNVDPNDPHLGNQAIELNFGARFDGLQTTQKQVLVSDGGAIADPATGNYVTKETLWDSVYDNNGNQIQNGDTMTFGGFNHNGQRVSLTYNIDTSNKVSDLLDQLGSTFGGTATIDASGHLRLADNNGGDSGLAITNFTTTSATGALPFGQTIGITSSKTQIISAQRGLTTASGAPPDITADTLWSSVYDESGNQIANGTQLVFTGTKGDGTTIDATTAGNTYTVQYTNTVQDLLDHLENLFDVDASIDQNGRLVLSDRVSDSPSYTSSLAISSITPTPAGAADIFGYGTPFQSILADSTGLIGSQQGDTISASFAREALSSTQYSAPSTTIFQDQDGFASGFLQSVSVDTDGIITGHYSNGQVLKQAQVSLATFNSVSGLFKEGGNIFTETSESGAPITGAPKTNGLGSIAPNSLEQSNVDLGTEFVKLITVQRGFQANSKIITTTDDMLNDLINIKR